MAAMEYPWSLLFLAIFSAAVAYLSYAVSRRRRLPPGPSSLPFVGNPSLLGKTVGALVPNFKQLRSVYGSNITLHIGSRPFIFISDHKLAHNALVTAGAAFADRPAFQVASYTGIFASRFGPAWRLLRRNLACEILHPSRLKSFSVARGSALSLLLNQIATDSEVAGCVPVAERFRHTMFSQLVVICFGDFMDEGQLKELRRIQKEVVMKVVQFNVFSFLPHTLSKFLFWKRWNEIREIRKKLFEFLLPLIQARKEIQSKKKLDHISYVDSLLKLQIPEEGGRKLSEKEMIILCSEFVGTGTDTTVTTFEWVMANLVKYPDIQIKLAEEIESVMGEKAGDIVGEEDLHEMKYLRAVVMEALRRHSPTYFGVPHAVVEEVELEGYVIPKNAWVNFAVAEMGLDEKVWEAPMEFRPERFLGEEKVDITCTKEIKMMPFGAGRRICPAMNLAILHLEWFVANLVWKFEWKPKDGEEVDLAESADEFTVCMKTPLEAVIAPRKKKTAKHI